MTEAEAGRYVQALVLGLEPAWRRLPEPERCEDAAAFCRAVERAGRVTTFTYSMIGLQPGAELLLWRLADSLEELEQAAAAALRAGLGRHLRVVQSMLGIIQPSQYVKRNEHMRVGHEYPKVRQLLAYSFGVDDQDFLVAYETDDLADFSNLVRDLRGTESRRSTVRDTPILTCVHRPLGEILGMLGEPA